MFGELLLVAQLATGTIDYADAKARADRHEAALDTAQTAALVKSQGEAVGRAFAACMPVPAPTSLPSFTVVLELDRTGHPARTWRKGDTDFAKCIQRKFATSNFFQPPSAPFYTSFEFTFTP